MKRHKIFPNLTPTQLQRFKRRLVRRGKCLECTGYNINGYAVVKLNGKYYFAHRLAYFLATGADPKQNLVLHSCDNPPCCLPKHLSEGTSLDNMQDKLRKGRHRSNPPRGSSAHNAKLTVAKVRAIRKSKQTHRALAKRYGVNHRVIGRIKSRQMWKHVK